MSHLTVTLTALVSSAIAIINASAQVDDWFMDKGIIYRQSSDNTQPLTAATWAVEVGVTTLAPGNANNVTLSGGGITSPLPLEYDEGEWFLEREFESEAELNALFPSNANYTITLSGGTLGTLIQNFTLGAPDYPAIPYLTGADHTASQNIHANTGFTFNWNAPGAFATGISLEVEDPISGDEITDYEFNSEGAPTSQLLSSAFLEAGHAYSAYLSFLNTTETSGAGGFGTTGYIEHSSNLIFDFQTLLSPTPDEIVGAWQFGDSSTDDSGLLVFQSNGTYFHVEDTSPGGWGTDGVEMGTYSLNEVGVLSRTVLVDTNGDIGLSHPNGTDILTIEGDSLSVTDDEETSVLTRVAYDPANPLVGAWRLCDNNNSNTGVIVFLANGYYFHGEVDHNGDPAGQSGMERGSYSLNAVTGVLTATPIVDTNLEFGLSDPLIGFDEVTITGNVSLKIYDGEPFFLHRVSNAAIHQDWRINKSRNFTQIEANTAPTNADFWDVWALVETRNIGDAGAVTISGGNLAGPRPFDNEGEGEWTYEKDYPNQAALDAEFPNNQIYTLIVSGGALGTRIQTIDIESVGYPPAPYLTGTNLTDAQNINPASAFTFTWNSPEDSVTNLVLTSEPDEDGIEYFDEKNFSGTSTGVTVPGGTLAEGNSGYGYLEFARSNGNVSGDGGFGVSGFSGRQSITLNFTFDTSTGDDGGLGDAAAEAGLTGEDALPNAKPFGDGIDNLLKFAFNMNLSGYDNGKLAPGGNSGLPTFALKNDEGESTFEIEFIRRVGSSLTYTAQRSDTLGGFTEMVGAVTVTPIAGGEFERVTVSEPCDPALVPRCFGRALVTAP